jgi:hypothetical protein
MERELNEINSMKPLLADLFDFYHTIFKTATTLSLPSSNWEFNFKNFDVLKKAQIMKFSTTCCQYLGSFINKIDVTYEPTFIPVFTVTIFDASKLKISNVITLRFKDRIEKQVIDSIISEQDYEKLTELYLLHNPSITTSDFKTSIYATSFIAKETVYISKVTEYIDPKDNSFISDENILNKEVFLDMLKFWESLFGNDFNFSYNVTDKGYAINFKKFSEYPKLNLASAEISRMPFTSGSTIVSIMYYLHTKYNLKIIEENPLLSLLVAINMNSAIYAYCGNLYNNNSYQIFISGQFGKVNSVKEAKEFLMNCSFITKSFLNKDKSDLSSNFHTLVDEKDIGLSKTLNSMYNKPEYDDFFLNFKNKIFMFNYFSLIMFKKFITLKSNEFQDLYKKIFI